MKITNKQAITAQLALGNLTSMNLPIKASMEIAYLSNAVERQVQACCKVRDTLTANYKIKLGIGTKPGQITFTTDVAEADKAVALAEFSSKVNELMDCLGEDITTTISLPDSIIVTPDTLKPLLPFLK